jgi:hypothetical protein
MRPHQRWSRQPIRHGIGPGTLVPQGKPDLVNPLIHVSVGAAIIKIIPLLMAVCRAAEHGEADFGAVEVEAVEAVVGDKET